MAISNVSNRAINMICFQCWNPFVRKYCTSTDLIWAPKFRICCAVSMRNDWKLSRPWDGINRTPVILERPKVILAFCRNLSQASATVTSVPIPNARTQFAYNSRSNPGWWFRCLVPTMMLSPSRWRAMGFPISISGQKVLKINWNKMIKNMRMYEERVFRYSTIRIRPSYFLSLSPLGQRERLNEWLTSKWLCLEKTGNGRSKWKMTELKLNVLITVNDHSANEWMFHSTDEYSSSLDCTLLAKPTWSRRHYVCISKPTAWM